jgi:hypothetical protein
LTDGKHDALDLGGAGNHLSRIGGSLMDIERNSHRTAVSFFAVAVAIAILAAFLTTLEWGDTRTANKQTPPGTTGLAKPRPPLGRAPGQPIVAN